MSIYTLDMTTSEDARLSIEFTADQAELIIETDKEGEHHSVRLTQEEAEMLADTLLAWSKSWSGTCARDEKASKVAP